MILNHGEMNPPIPEVSYSLLPNRVRKLLGFVQSTLKWRLMDRKPLDKWIHDSGRVILLGDACHPMLVRCIAYDLLLGIAADIRSKPYIAQGASAAIEDGAVLGNLLSRISHISQLGPLLKAYQDLRLPRTAEIQSFSRFNQYTYHLPDGPEQIKRDEGLKKAMALQLSDNSEALPREPTGNQNKPADRAVNDILFGYDADFEVDKWWAAQRSWGGVGGACGVKL
jgi:salicylate hydroxylase